MINPICAPLHHRLAPTIQHVEVASAFQIPALQIVGLPAREIDESRERIKSAVESSSLEMPRRRVVVNLSPADIRKRGTGLDLPIALAILAHEHTRREPGSSANAPLLMAWAELGLNGTLRPVGQITRALWAAALHQVPMLLISEDDAANALRALRLVQARKKDRIPRVFTARTLGEAWALVQIRLRAQEPPVSRSAGAKEITLPDADTAEGPEPHPNLKAEPTLLPLSPGLERIICVAVAGRHHIFLLGPRGSGKTYALEWLHNLQPPPDAETRLSHALAAELTETGLPAHSIARVPLRRLNPQIRPASLLGCCVGSSIKPGECTLAHGGVLLADEFPEWPRDAREALREPLELGRIQLHRRDAREEMPSDFQLAATGNLCPCGAWPPYKGAGTGIGARLRCRCTAIDRSRYLSRLSGPILDRIDIGVIHAPDVSTTPRRTEPTRLDLLRERIRAMRIIAIDRWGQLPGRMGAEKIEEIIQNDYAEFDRHPALQRSSGLRSRHKIFRVAMTLSLWDESPRIESKHWIEAAFYRLDLEQLTNPNT